MWKLTEVQRWEDKGEGDPAKNGLNGIGTQTRSSRLEEGVAVVVVEVLSVQLLKELHHLLGG